MPRNGSGTYAPPNGSLANIGTTISPTAYNALVVDIGTELTASVNVNGTAPMQASLNMGSHSILAVATPVNATDGANKAYVDAITPSGAVVMFAGSAAPSGWLLCDGSLISRTTYAALFAAIGTTYGAGDGSTTFALPDARGRGPVAAGSGSGLTTRAVGATGGEEAHTLVAAELPVNAYQAAAHTHGTTEAAHSHTYPYTRQGGYSSGGGQGVYDNGYGSNTASTNGASTGLTVNSATVTISNPTGGGAHNNMSPFLVLNFIIKT